jgi:hypothetical protein
MTARADLPSFCIGYVHLDAHFGKVLDLVILEERQQVCDDVRGVLP